MRFFPPFRRCRRISLGLFAGLAVLCSGCGVNEYEQKMAAEQVRLEYFDQERDYLDEPIDSLPRKSADEEKHRPTPAIFIRPPKGIARTTNPKEPLLGDVFYRFVGKSGLFQDVFIAASKDQKDFIRAVVQRPFPEGVVWDAGKDFVVKPHYREKAIQFTRWEFTKEGGKRTIIFATKNEPAAAAIVFVVNPNQPSGGGNSKIEKAIELSLATLALQTDSNKPKSDYQLMKAHAKG